MNRFRGIAGVVLGLVILPPAASAQTGDAMRGERVFRACIACHSLEPDRNMTGPSLAGLWSRKTGGLSSFARYSAAMKAADLAWDDKSLDGFLEDPQHFIPGNTMTFPGIRNAQQRADVLAFLKQAAQPGGRPSRAAEQDDHAGGMMGMTGGQAVPDLKRLDPAQRVRAINYCRDTYRVTRGDGKTQDFWERNLRFKTDSSHEGPEKGAPAILPAGMMGDRASIIFAAPEEISSLIAHAC
jgi:cytochrome c